MATKKTKAKPKTDKPFFEEQGLPPINEGEYFVYKAVPFMIRSVTSTGFFAVPKASVPDSENPNKRKG